MNTVGKILLITRNSKNLSISDISIELKISKSIIIDLENDNIKNNPDIIFNIGHLRSYSNFLELDTDTIIERFKNDISFNIKEEKKNITPIVVRATSAPFKGKYLPVKVMTNAATKGNTTNNQAYSAKIPPSV